MTGKEKEKAARSNEIQIIHENTNKKTMYDIAKLLVQTSNFCGI